MQGILEGMVAIIVLLVLLQALFPEILAAIVATSLTALFLGILIIAFGVVIWLFMNLNQ